MFTAKICWFLILVLISFFTIIYQTQLFRIAESIRNLEIICHRFENISRKDEFKDKEENDNFVILYNRVPKTASTSFMGIAYDICKRNNFHVLHINVSANSHVLSWNNQFDLVNNITKWNEKKPAIYHGHFAYIHFQKFGVTNPLYINIIRKPLERFVSYYYFIRYGDNYRPYLIRRKHGDKMTFDECVSKKLPDCDPSNLWLQIPFFCGHAANCWKPGNKWALNEAKKNLLNNYLIVGVTEELEDFVSILEQTLPRFFKSATEHFLQSNKSHLRQTVQKDPLSKETISIIKQSPIWRMENEFYEFALEQFHFIKKQTLQNKMQNFFFEKIRPKQS